MLSRRSSALPLPGGDGHAPRALSLQRNADTAFRGVHVRAINYKHYEYYDSWFWA